MCLFTNILKPIYATLREKRYLNVGYIEDLYLQGGDLDRICPLQLQEQVREVLLFVVPHI